jgi:hypothetical protein
MVARRRAEARVNCARVDLRGREWFTHYYVGAMSLFAGVALEYFHSVTPAGSPKHDGAAPFYGMAFIAVGAFTIWWQRRALRFRRIRTRRTAAENYAAVVALAEHERWRLAERRDAFSIQALTGPEWPRSYKRRTTVLFDGQDVYVSSIMNPGRFWTPGAFSFGGISDDISAVASAVAEHVPKSKHAGAT